MSALQNWSGKKFFTTNFAMVQGTVVTLLALYSSPPQGFFTALAALYILLAAGITSYNWANLRQAQNGSAPR